MTFNSLIFIFVALPVFFLIYKKMPIDKRKIAIFIMSFLFYFWIEPIYSIELLVLCGYIFILSNHMAKAGGRKRRLLLIEIVSIVIFLLVYFKYYGFILSTFESIARTKFTFQLFLVPAAISFVSFTLVSYAVDVYRGKARAMRFVDFGLYVFFFPKILMGPIVRFEDFNNQGIGIFNFSQCAYGLRRFVIGLGKKVILADSFAAVYGQMSQLQSPSMLTAWLLAFAFSFQIYFDFSGYSDMAIGISHMFGYKLKENFNYPYVSMSIKEFWHRWHISLSGWFRDYVYIPLGGSRCSLKRVIFNTFVVWFLTGLWHGASWNFIIWGLYYFVLLMIERYVISKRTWHISDGLKVFFTFILVTIGWVFFSFTDFSKMIDQLQAMVGVNGFSNMEFLWYFKNNFVLFIAGIIGSTPFIRNLSRKLQGTKWDNVRDVAFVVVFVISIACIIKSSFTPFLYVQF